MFVIGVLAGYLGYRAVDDQPVSNAASPPKTVAAPLTIVSVSDFDPEGDQTENPEDVTLTVDGSAATFWATESYQDRDVGGLKPGVGLVFDLGESKLVDRVEVDTPDSDWSAQVYTSDSVPATLAGWGTPLFLGAGLGSNAQLALEPPTRGRNVLLWITDLPPNQPYRLRVAEVRVVGSS